MFGVLLRDVLLVGLLLLLAEGVHHASRCSSAAREEEDPQRVVDLELRHQLPLYLHAHRLVVVLGDLPGSEHGGGTGQ